MGKNDKKRLRVEKQDAPEFAEDRFCSILGPLSTLEYISRCFPCDKPVLSLKHANFVIGVAWPHL